MSDPSIFIVGNSRSGTTMMMQILNRHPRIHSINEPHFFEQLWSPADQDVLLEEGSAVELIQELLTIQRDGYFAPRDPDKHARESVDILKQLPASDYTRLRIYQHYLGYEARLNGKEIACEKTPQNVFYLQEIMQNFEEVRIINMIRDPRAVLLSQKRKWKRRFLGGTFIPYKEMFRLMINYHPLTIGRLWNASLGAGHRYNTHPDLYHLRFEDLVANPTETASKICQFLGLAYDPEILQIPQTGSSVIPDRPDQKGIREGRTEQWKTHLSSTEIFICQWVCRRYMKEYGYEPVKIFPNPFIMLWSLLIFPVKLTLALIINLKRMRSSLDTLRRRFSPT